MSLVRFDPFSALREFDRFFESPRREHAWLPRVDVFDEDGALVVRAEVPGVDPESIDVTVEGGRLTISGSRSFVTESDKAGYHRKEIFEGTFSRSVLLPDGTDPDGVSASSKDGILEITVPKRPEVLPRTVKVEVKS